MALTSPFGVLRAVKTSILRVGWLARQKVYELGFAFVSKAHLSRGSLLIILIAQNSCRQRTPIPLGNQHASGRNQTGRLFLLFTSLGPQLLRDSFFHILSRETPNHARPPLVANLLADSLPTESKSMQLGRLKARRGNQKQ